MSSDNQDASKIAADFGSWKDEVEWKCRDLGITPDLSWRTMYCSHDNRVGIQLAAESRSPVLSNKRKAETSRADLQTQEQEEINDAK